MATINILKNVRELDSNVNEFLNNISEAAILFKDAIAIYMSEGLSDDFEEKIKSIGIYETRNDQLRRKLESKMYSNTLIPESRSDVLSLLEGLDGIINAFEKVTKDFSIENPTITSEFHSLFDELAEVVLSSVEALVTSSRSFFVDTQRVNDSLHKVMFFEKQGDASCEKLNRKIYASETLSLPEKNQLRKFADNIDDISDIAEDVADKLSIFTIKRLV